MSCHIVSPRASPLRWLPSWFSCSCVARGCLIGLRGPGRRAIQVDGGSFRERGFCQALYSVLSIGTLFSLPRNHRRPVGEKTGPGWVNTELQAHISWGMPRFRPRQSGSRACLLNPRLCDIVEKMWKLQPTASISKPKISRVLLGGMCVLRTVVVLLWRWCPAASSTLPGGGGVDCRGCRTASAPSRGCHAALGAQ